MGKPSRKIDITQFKHKKKKRKNNPPIGLVSNETEPLRVEKKKKYAFDEHLSPELNFDSKRAEIEKIIDRGLSGSEQEAKIALEKLKQMQEPYLNWTGKAEQTSFEVPTVSLHIHEKIDSRAIIEKVRKTNSVNYEQLSLFKKEQIIPENEAIDFYKHDKGWSNRLVAGDSLLVMNSLLEKDRMAGKIQCIYIDPPYGKNFGSNFQPFTNKKDVKDKRDEDLTAEPETLKAFRDTWELGIHSYLTYLRDRLLLARELLTDSGSCFVQISDENVHLVRNLMDEIFGVNNFIGIVLFKTATNQNAKRIQRLYDCLVWYGKTDDIKFRNLYRERTQKEVLNIFNNYDNNLKKRYKVAQLKKQLTKEQFERLTVQKRIFGNKYWKRYEDDFNYTKYDNVWRGTIISTFSKEKTYAVQTSTIPIQRCILMTTDPGDIVLDPTCGSGTTAYVAEKWGRRWITCDTSRVAITLAKQRLITSVFDYYELKNKDEGISSGFQYKNVPHITLSSIADNEPPKMEVLYDQPLKDNKKARVAGPFTVEAVPSQFVQVVGQEKKHSFKYGWLDEVRKTGIRGKKGIATDMDFANLKKLSGFKYLHAEGETKNPRKVIISFGSEHSPLDKRQVELALKEVKEKKEKPDILVFASFHFDPEASRLINEQSSEKLKMIPVQMNMDLQTSDLKKKASSNESFWLIGSPDVKIKNGVGGNKDEYTVEVHGWDYYNPSSGKIESGGKDRIAMWILDTDYDDRAIFPRQVFFPMAGKK